MVKLETRRSIVDTRQQPSDFEEIAFAHLVGAAAAYPWKDRKVDAFCIGKRLAAREGLGGTDRNFELGQTREQAMLVEDGLFRPAAGPVKLRDYMATLFEFDVVDAILKGAHGKAAAGRTLTCLLYRFEDSFGCKRKEIHAPGISPTGRECRKKKTSLVLSRAQ